jgi:hypothetical protein
MVDCVANSYRYKYEGTPTIGLEERDRTANEIQLLSQAEGEIPAGWIR